MVLREINYMEEVEFRLGENVRSKVKQFNHRAEFPLIFFILIMEKIYLYCLHEKYTIYDY